MEGLDALQEALSMERIHVLHYGHIPPSQEGVHLSGHGRIARVLEELHVLHRRR
jgi:hypothetical protein